MTIKRPVGRPRITDAQQTEFREKIVRVARELFFKDGIESVSMRKIARELECNPMSLYQYFENKHAILQQIWEVIFDELHDLCKNAAVQKQSSIQKLQAVCRTFFCYWVDNPHYYSVIYVNSDPKAIALGEKVFGQEDRGVFQIYKIITDLITNCCKQGTFKMQDPAKMVQLTFANMLGAILCINTIPEYKWMGRDSFADTTLDNTFRGFGLAPE